jgi:hypothetical protein
MLLITSVSIAQYTPDQIMRYLAAYNKRITTAEVNTMLLIKTDSLFVAYSIPATKHLAQYNITVSNQTVNTISLSTFKTIIKKGNFFCNSDTIEVDTNPSFTSPIVAYPYSSTFAIENIDPNTFKNIYIKRLGTGNGTASYNYSLWGN